MCGHMYFYVLKFFLRIIKRIIDLILIIPWLLKINQGDSIMGQNSYRDLWNLELYNVNKDYLKKKKDYLD